MAPKRSNTSGATGVSQRGDRWNACVTVNRKRINLGRFATFAEAVYARTAAVRALVGDFAPDDPLLRAMTGPDVGDDPPIYRDD